ncbi:MAG: GNAT family N-acetyltransferase [Bdellovibrionaceae bacterium]|nr:GNAT family N-acetyltransferase [Pseudobdellovibrionaceae bacterium]
MKNTVQKTVQKTVGTVRSVKVALEKLNAQIKIHHHKIKKYEPRVRFEFERGHFRVKTAVSGAELETCLRLRFDVFHKEFMNKKRTVGVDIDKLDFICDHLVIIDTRENRTIGTYRLNCSKFNDTFYSANEFQMERLLAMPGNKLEMGRACIDKEYRTGAVMALLWRGIVEYAQVTESKYLFGCGSIKTTDKFESALIYKWLRDHGHMNEEFDIVPTKKFRISGFQECLAYIEASPGRFNDEAVRELIPTLIHSYLKAGSKLCGEPALDLEFSCIDFLTLLKVEEMSALFQRKFKI